MLLKTFFLIIFRNFHNSSFSNILSKIYEEIILKSLIKWVYYRPFSGKLPTISECSKETFFLESAFAAGVRKSGLQVCNGKKKGQFWKYFRGIFEISEHPLISEHFQNISVAQSGSCRLYSWNSIKREIHTTFWSPDQCKVTWKIPKCVSPISKDFSH